MHSNGTARLRLKTNNARLAAEALVVQFDAKCDRRLLFRRLGVCAADVEPETDTLQLDLFTDYTALQRERKIQRAMLSVRRKYGPNALFTGKNLMEGATTLERNQQIGGHRA